VVAACGGLLAFLTVRSDVLRGAEEQASCAPGEDEHGRCPYDCPVAGTPLRAEARDGRSG
jgi:hypothetical protein